MVPITKQELRGNWINWLIFSLGMLAPLFSPYLSNLGLVIVIIAMLFSGALYVTCLLSNPLRMSTYYQPAELTYVQKQRVLIILFILLFDISNLSIMLYLQTK